MKKRVLVFVPEFPVVTETFIERELVHLSKSSNLDLKIFSLKKGVGNLSLALDGKVENINISILDIGVGFFQVLFSNFSGIIRCLKIGGLKHLYLLLKSFGYASVFSYFEPEIIYAHFMSFPSTIGMFCSILLKCDFAVSAHARDVFEYPELPKEKLQNAKFITICNKSAYERFLAISNPSKSDTSKVHLIYHGVPSEGFSMNKIATTVSEEKMILMVGRLVEKKGVKYLLEAFKKLKNRNPSAKVRIEIIGTGPLKEDLKAFLQKLGLGSNILVGEKSFSEVLERLKICDLYVQPSIDLSTGDSDGIPNTLIEAAMLGLPIITTNAGSISEFLDENSAVIVPQSDSEDLSLAMERLLKEEGLGLKLGAAAKVKAHEMFALEANVSKIEKLLLI
uniref:Colanic acid biosynthesis glycosyltransferase WcaL n=1 Tax=candidate division WWE3 bacterium TaxID=2053526 RepID=A0A7C4Y2X1_UNCKA